MNQHLMAEVKFIAPGEEGTAEGNLVCPDLRTLEGITNASELFHKQCLLCSSTN